MEAIYNTQDFWRIESYYSESPGTISQAFIKYLKPDGITVGEFSATNDAVNLMFYKEGSLEEYLEAGKWTVWIKLLCRMEELYLEVNEHLQYKKKFHLEQYVMEIVIKILYNDYTMISTRGFNNPK